MLVAAWLLNCENFQPVHSIKKIATKAAMCRYFLQNTRTYFFSHLLRAHKLLCICVVSTCVVWCSYHAGWIFVLQKRGYDVCTTTSLVWQRRQGVNLTEKIRGINLILCCLYMCNLGILNCTPAVYFWRKINRISFFFFYPYSQFSNHFIRMNCITILQR